MREVTQPAGLGRLQHMGAVAGLLCPGPWPMVAACWAAQEAKRLIAERWTVPEEVRKRRRRTGRVTYSSEAYSVSHRSVWLLYVTTGGVVLYG